LAPAVAVTFAQGQLNLTELTPGASATTAVTIFEPNPNQLEIDLTGGNFDHTSTTSPPLTYNVPFSPTQSISVGINFQSNPITSLNILLPGEELDLGPINNWSGGLRQINVVEANTIVVTGKVSTTHVTQPSFGNVNLVADQSVTLTPGSEIETTNGTVTLHANQTGSVLPPPGGSTGITIDGATIQTKGSGSIDLEGVGAASAPADFDLDGILVEDGSVVQTLGSGNVTLVGTGGNGSGGNAGVRIEGSGTQVTTAAGNLLITGTGGQEQDAGTLDDGIQVLDGATVSAGGLGSVTLTGTWSAAAIPDNVPPPSPLNVGVWIADTTGFGLPTSVTTAGGNLQIISTSVDPGDGNTGILVGPFGQVIVGGQGTATLTDLGGQGITIDEGTVQTGSGALTITATQGLSPRLGAFTGIAVTGGTVESTSGNIQLTGAGGYNPASSVGLAGIALTAGTSVLTAGTITLTGTGGFGPGNDYGVLIDSSVVSAGSGFVYIFGTGGYGPDGGNDGVNMNDAGGSVAQVFAGTLSVIGTPGVTPPLALPSFGIDLPAAQLNATTISLIGDSMELAPVATTITASGTLTLKQLTPGVQIVLGGAVHGVNRALNLFSPDLSTIAANTVIIGSATSGNIYLGGPITAGPRFINLLLQTSGSVTAPVLGSTITVNTLAIQAAKGVGTVGAFLSTKVANLAISAGANGLYVSNAGNLTVASALGVSGLTASTGNLSVLNAGKLTLSANVTNTGPGSITLTTIDAVIPGQDINVGAGVTVKASAGNVVLQAGDNLSLDPLSKILTSGLGTITLSIHYLQPGQADPDPLVGNVAKVLGLVQASLVTIQGFSAVGDTFYVTPSAATQISVVGNGPPAVNHLILVLINPTTITLQQRFSTFGYFRFSNGATLSYNGFSAKQITIDPSSAPSSTTTGTPATATAATASTNTTTSTTTGNASTATAATSSTNQSTSTTNTKTSSSGTESTSSTSTSTKIPPRNH